MKFLLHPVRLLHPVCLIDTTEYAHHFTTAPSPPLHFLDLTLPLLAIFDLNPKRPGLFGQLDTRGGAAAAHFRERRLELPNFHFCPQTVFHMKAGIFS